MARYTKNEAATVPALNTELEKIETAIQDTLSRKGDTPNIMEAPIDMNSNRIMNLPEPASNAEPVRKADFDLFAAEARADVDEAIGDAEAAALAATTAAGVANTAAGNTVAVIAEAEQSIEDLNNSITNTGWFSVAGSFTDGGTITAYNEVLFDTATGAYYSWGGSLPKVVPESSTVAGTGGEGVTAWTNRGDAALRSELENEAVPSLAYGDDDKTYKRISGVLRQSTAAGGWSALNDSGHNSTGIDTLTISGKNLIMAYDFSASKVSHLTLTPDETYASQGLIFGASVGTSSATISAYAPLSGRVSSGVLDFNASLGQVVSFVSDAPNGKITVTHNGRPSVAQAVNVTNSTNAVNGEFIVSANSTTGFTLQWTSPLAGRFAYNGTNFVLTESTNVAGSVTAAWNGTLNCMRVSHPNIGTNNNSISVLHSRDAPTRYLITVDTVSSSSFDVFFYDLTGALITAPTTSMIVYVSRNSNIPSVLPSTVGVASFDAGVIQCDMNQLHGSGANVWVDGLMLK